MSRAKAATCNIRVIFAEFVSAGLPRINIRLDHSPTKPIELLHLEPIRQRLGPSSFPNSLKWEGGRNTILVPHCRANRPKAGCNLKIARFWNVDSALDRRLGQVFSPLQALGGDSLLETAKKHGERWQMRQILLQNNESTVNSVPWKNAFDAQI